MDLLCFQYRAAEIPDWQPMCLSSDEQPETSLALGLAFCEQKMAAYEGKMYLLSVPRRNKKRQSCDGFAFKFRFERTEFMCDK